jgi:hypothetical protein
MLTTIIEIPALEKEKLADWPTTTTAILASSPDVINRPSRGPVRMLHMN